jgi:hypothetical protein
LGLDPDPGARLWREIRDSAAANRFAPDGRHRQAGDGRDFIAVGLALWFDLHQVVEGWLLQSLPAWLIDFSASI